jgi:glycosyltransferase involved in cell wall biosynthesis
MPVTPAPSRSPRSIVHVAQVEITRESGMGRVAWHWRQELEARGYDFVHVGPAALGRAVHPALFPFAAYRHCRRLRLRPAAIVVHEPAGFPFVMGRTPVIAFSHGLERRGWQAAVEQAAGSGLHIRARSRLLFPLWRLLPSDLTLVRARALLVLNSDDRDYVLRRYRRRAEDVFLFRNGVDPDEPVGRETRAAEAGETGAAEAGEARAVQPGEARAAETGETRAGKAGEARAVQPGETRAAETGEARAAEADEARAAETGEDRTGGRDEARRSGSGAGVAVAGPGGGLAAPMATVLFLASWLPRKGIVTLVEAARRLQARAIAPRFLLAGTGKAAAEVLADWPDGLRQAVAVLPRFDPAEEAALYAQASVFVLPSFFEGQPLALLQAMGAGLCCIGSDIAGTRDLIAHRRTGLLFPPGNAARLADCLAEALQSPALRTDLGRNARRAVAGRAWESVAAEVADFVEEVIRRG